MCVRRKANRSGTTSVVVVDKSSGKFKELKVVGIASSPQEIAELDRQGRRWIDEYTRQQTIDFDESERVMQEVDETILHIESTLHNTPQVILNHIYDSIGFNAIDDDILRHLVIARVCQPQSKGCNCRVLEIILRRGYPSAQHIQVHG